MVCPKVLSSPIQYHIWFIQRFSWIPPHLYQIPCIVMHFMKVTEITMANLSLLEMTINGIQVCGSEYSVYSWKSKEYIVKRVFTFNYFTPMALKNSYFTMVWGVPNNSYTTFKLGNWFYGWGITHLTCLSPLAWVLCRVQRGFAKLLGIVKTLIWVPHKAYLPRIFAKPFAWVLCEAPCMTCWGGGQSTQDQYLLGLEWNIFKLPQQWRCGLGLRGQVPQNVFGVNVMKCMYLHKRIMFLTVHTNWDRVGVKHQKIFL